MDFGVLELTSRDEVETDSDETESIEEQKCELYYQRILEKRHNGGHLKTLTGVTDITTPTMHIEIKKAKGWVKALRQLLAYNYVAPRHDLRLYLFDTHELTGATKTNMMTTLASESAPHVSLYKLDAEGNETVIYNALGLDRGRP